MFTFQPSAKVKHSQHIVHCRPITAAINLDQQHLFKNLLLPVYAVTVIILLELKMLASNVDFLSPSSGYHIVAFSPTL